MAERGLVVNHLRRERRLRADEGMTFEHSPRRMMYQQILSQPALLRETFDQAERAVYDALAHVQPRHWQVLYTAGCGDSFYAGLACEMALARFTGLPVKALAAMQFARYEADCTPSTGGFFGISNSGNVSRSIEAVGLARAAGLETIAITGNAESGIAREAAHVAAVPVPAMGRSPGIRSYTIQLLTLFLCAIRVGELRQVLSADSAAAWRQNLRDVATCMEATLEAIDPLTKSLAEGLRDAYNWMFLGSGPAYATALFCAAKMVESCGINAWGQDIEEWAHVQFFNQEERTPTCLIMPPGRSLGRALEVLPYIKGIGRHTMVVAHSAQTILPTQAHSVFPVALHVSELFSPLVYCLAGELLAYYLAEYRDADFFQPSRGFGSSGDRLRNSYMVRTLEELRETS